LYDVLVFRQHPTAVWHGGQVFAWSYLDNSIMTTSIHVQQQDKHIFNF
jgi:hypothetical protein